MQLISRADGTGPVAVYHFSNIALPEKNADAKADVVPFEVGVTVERGGDFDPRGSNLSRMSVQIVNRATGQPGKLIELTPELGRASYVDVPREELAGGDFDLQVRGLSDGAVAGHQARRRCR